MTQRISDDSVLFLEDVFTNAASNKPFSVTFPKLRGTSSFSLSTAYKVSMHAISYAGVFPAPEGAKQQDFGTFFKPSRVLNS